MTNKKLRSDEEFVINAVANVYSGDWWPGEDPPDAYLKIADKTVAIEISTLTQHVNDGEGRMVPRLSKDETALRVCEELNQELNQEIPSGMSVLLTLFSPLTKARKLKPRLAMKIMELVKAPNASEVELEGEILSNKFKIHLLKEERPSGKKVIGLVPNLASNANILMNAKQILDDRIVVKTKKCKSLVFSGQLWLALFNDYWLASFDTYKQAMDQPSVHHPFDRILIVAGDRTVSTLHEKHTNNH